MNIKRFFITVPTYIQIITNIMFLKTSLILTSWLKSFLSQKQYKAEKTGTYLRLYYKILKLH